eukprot:403373066
MESNQDQKVNQAILSSPQHKSQDKVIMSQEGFVKNFNLSSGKYLYWTDDVNVELPIIIREGDQVPIRTIPQVLKSVAKKNPQAVAFQVKRKKDPKASKMSYIKWTWKQYYRDVVKFAAALIKFGVKERGSINLIGFNAPEWAIAFFGTISANCIPSGVYTTNTPEACLYQANHSEAELIVAENEEHMLKYLSQSENLPKLRGIVIYDDDASKLRSKYSEKKNLILGWTEFLSLADDYNEKKKLKQIVNERINLLKPGNCCNIVYTSGTTGPPKGVMLSHDNMIYNMSLVLQSVEQERGWSHDGSERMVSYLPLSHSAAQCTDLLLPMLGHATLTFARPDALQGTLVDTLKDVRPTLFFAVPRVWEKFEEKLKEIGEQAGGFARSISGWAKDKAFRHNINMQTHPQVGYEKGDDPSITYPIAKHLILNRIKAAMGLDQSKIFAYAAAPMNRRTQEYFSSLDMVPLSIYGMSESSGGVTTWTESKSRAFTCGVPIPGVTIKIDNPDEKGIGEICMKGRCIFLGYYKNEEATREIFDKDGFIHSGDLGSLRDGFLEITGRIKELIITAGGENIAPILIEHAFQETCPMCANIMVVGDDKKFLSAIITLKSTIDMKLQKPSHDLSQECLNLMKQHVKNSENIKTTDDAIKSEEVRKYIQECMEQTNKIAISRAQHIRKWIIVPDDFSVSGGELTPSLKMRRKIIEKKYEQEIEKLYQEPKL